MEQKIRLKKQKCKFNKTKKNDSSQPRVITERKDRATVKSVGFVANYSTCDTQISLIIDTIFSTSFWTDVLQSSCYKQQD